LPINGSSEVENEELLSSTTIAFGGVLEEGLVKCTGSALGEEELSKLSEELSLELVEKGENKPLSLEVFIRIKNNAPISIKGRMAGISFFIYTASVKY